MKVSTPDKHNLRQQQASARRQQILETAVRLFAQQGVAGTTTRQIAQEVGVAEGLIFHYFPTKLDLVRAVTDSHHVFLGELRAILNDADTHSIAEVMKQVATSWLGLLWREANVSSIIFAEAQINPEIGAIVQEVIETGAGGIETLLNARRDAGEIRSALDIKTVAHMYMASILMFFLRYRHLNDRDWKKESAAFADHLLAAWLHMVMV